MQLSHSNTLDALRRVQGFLTTQAAALGTLVSTTLRARLDDAVTQLTAFQARPSTPRWSSLPALCGTPTI
jgi:hypothetical protein